MSADAKTNADDDKGGNGTITDDPECISSASHHVTIIESTDVNEMEVSGEIVIACESGLSQEHSIRTKSEPITISVTTTANDGSMSCATPEMSSKAGSPVSSSEQQQHSSTSINKKKFGKFRILLDNDQQMSDGAGEFGAMSESECTGGKTTPCESPARTTLNITNSSCNEHLSLHKTVQQFIPPTLLATTESLETVKDTFKPNVSDSDSESDEDMEDQQRTAQPSRRGRPPGRRGRRKPSRLTRPKRSNSKKEVEVGSQNEESLSTSRRRSTRIKSLEEKKDTENSNETTEININVGTESNEQHQESAESVSQSTASEIKDEPVEKSQFVETKPEESKERSRTTKSSSRRHKSSKDKSKDKDKEKEKKRRYRRKKVNSDDDENDSKRNNDDSKASTKEQSSCFTHPLPPSESNHKLISVPTWSKTSSDSEDNPKPEKVKSRWRRNSELESVGNFLPSDRNASVLNSLDNRANAILDGEIGPTSSSSVVQTNGCDMESSKENEPAPYFQRIDENIYFVEKKKTKFTKEVKKMVCDCILTKEERHRGIMGCGEDCLNRMLMIECGSRCPLGDHCANKRFLRKQYAKVEPFKTAKKGWGLRATQPLPEGSFIMEYVGEVIGPKEFKSRVKKYSREGHEHHFFMALKADEIIDATTRGNITRFVNHSCDPNSETQKWTVNGELRIGFFTSRNVEMGEEITFDYQFQRYGKVAQKCYCESYNCRGYIGANEVDEIEINLEGMKLPKVKTKEKEEIAEKPPKEEFEDLGLEEEIDKLKESGGLRNRKQCLMLARLMVRAEDTQNRIRLLEVMRDTQEVAYLRLLIDYHGLQLLWSWMVDLEDVELKAEIIRILEILPIPNKTMLKDSRVIDVIEKWSKILDPKQPATEQQEKNVSETISESVSESVFESVPGTPQIENDSIVDELEIKEVAEALTPSESDAKELVKENGTKSASTCMEQNVMTTMDTTNTTIITTSSESSKAGVVTRTGREELAKFNIIKKDLAKEGAGLLNGKEEKSQPNIGMMALRLLTLWKDLKEVYRIPRLERQKRHEDEKEADRKALENEEKMSKGMFVYVDNKIRIRSQFEDRENGQLFAYKKNLKRPFDPSRKGFPYQNGGNHTPYQNGQMPSDMQPSAPKLSKEEHRAYYNVELMRKDYEEAMRQYKKQMEQFNSAIQQQMHLSIAPLLPPMPPAPPPSIFGFSTNQAETAQMMQGPPPKPINQSIIAGHPYSTYPNSQSSQSSYISDYKIVPPQNDFTQMNGHGLYETVKSERLTPQQSGYGESITATNFTGLNNFEASTTPVQTPLYETNGCSDYDMRKELGASVFEMIETLPETIEDTKPKTTANSVLIECTSKDHELREDIKAVVHADYGVELVVSDPLQRKQQSINLFNCTYPAPGTYFVDQQRIYYVPSMFSRGTTHAYISHENNDFWPFERYETSVIQNIPPFMFPSKEEPKDRPLPTNWRIARDRHGFVYYYNRVTKKVQWNFPIVANHHHSSGNGTGFGSLSTNSGSIGSERTTCSEDTLKNAIISSVESVSTPRFGNDAADGQALVDESPYKTPMKLISLDSVPLPVPPPTATAFFTTTTAKASGEEIENDPRKRKTLPAVVTQLLSSITNGNTSNDSTFGKKLDLQSLKLNITLDDTISNAADMMGGDAIEYDSIIRMNSCSQSTSQTNNSNFVTTSNLTINNVNNAGFNKLSERKQKEKFKATLSEHIKACLNPYRKFDCKIGRILCNDDFKFLARKLTHMIMVKELKHCRSTDTLTVSDAVKHKSKEFVRKYMSKYGPFYRPDEQPDEKDDQDEVRDIKSPVLDSFSGHESALINAFQNSNSNSSFNTTPNCESIEPKDC